jgi:hypothetical protein
MFLSHTFSPNKQQQQQQQQEQQWIRINNKPTLIPARTILNHLHLANNKKKNAQGQLGQGCQG